MIQIKEVETPIGYVSCYSCGDKHNDIKSIVTYESVEINGKVRRVGGNIYGVNLCKDCRDKLRELLK